MKLYYSPGSCSMGIHLLLQETGVDFEIAKVSLAEGEQRSQAFREVNPKGKVPVLDAGTDGVITEYPAIAFYIAGLPSPTPLLPADRLAQVRALELIDYAVATVHMRGFARMAKPAVFSPDGDPKLVRDAGRSLVVEGLERFDAALGEKPYALGEFSIVDSALFFIEFWSRKVSLPMSQRLNAHHERMLARPAVRRMLQAEGLTPTPAV